MTRDRETGEAELVQGTAERLLREGDGPVTDEVVAHESGVDLPTVRLWLAESDGVRFAVQRDGDQVAVTALVR